MKKMMRTGLDERFGRERRTIDAMIGIYCHDHHGTGRDLCSTCGDLATYASERLAHCPFGADKPTCANCKVHCYRTDMRDRVKVVMRHAGPRMITRHPILAILHKWVDAGRDAPEKPRKGPATARTTHVA